MMKFVRLNSHPVVGHDLENPFFSRRSISIHDDNDNDDDDDDDVVHFFDIFFFHTRWDIHIQQRSRAEKSRAAADRRTDEHSLPHSLTHSLTLCP